MRVSGCLAIIAISAGLLAGCENNTGTGAQSAAPALPVVVSRAERQDVPLTVEMVGSTLGTQDVQIRARVEGFLESINFREGTFVKKGELLYTIDAQPFEAKLVEAERARTEQLLNAYQLTVLRSFQEVDDALVEIATYRNEAEAREAQVRAASSAARLSRARYDGGVTSYLEVLESERSLFRAELLASSTRRAQVVAVVSLYKALGGGWATEDEINAAGGFIEANAPPASGTP